MSLSDLKELLYKLQSCTSTVQKLTVLNDVPAVKELGSIPTVKTLCAECNPQEEVVIKAVWAIGQGPRVFQDINTVVDLKQKFRDLVKNLLEIEHHYDTIGGVIGYHITVQELLRSKQNHGALRQENTNYLHPPGYEISKETATVRQAIRWGILAMPESAEIYPVGGAGDRLNLHDPASGEALPAAELRFCGRTLLEGLIRDLQGREYLYYKLTGKQLNVPIALMTSQEKDNDQHIKRLCMQNKGFGRSKEKIQCFKQPLVPMVSDKGEWLMHAPLELFLKPGGHGVIWKLALDNQIFSRYLESGITSLLVRQINNPVAGIDYGILALLGLGSHYGKAFGFSSCKRLLNTAEGMDILLETKSSEGVEYCLTNIEYTEFAGHGLSDHPEEPQSPYSCFPANTNILFADLKKLLPLAEKNPIPGRIINLKSQEGGVPAGRLESTMQNIADSIVDHFPQPLVTPAPESLQTFLTYNERKKTIAAIKKSYSSGNTAVETPESCFYEILCNQENLFRDYCSIDLPHLGSFEEYLHKGPPFVILFHPALGPLYSVIAQKIQKGTLAEGSEMQLEIAELEMHNLCLKGSLWIEAESLLGNVDDTGVIQYGEGVGKCVLRNVTVANLGIDRTYPNNYWKNEIKRKEQLKILLQGESEFIAENVRFQGDQEVVVPDGHRMTATAKDGKVHYNLEKIKSLNNVWNYQFDEENRIKLGKREKDSPFLIKLMKQQI